MSFNLAAVKMLGDALGDASESRPVARKRSPEPINSDITRDHWLEMPGCYHKDTCLRVKDDHKDGKDGKDKPRLDYHQCLSFAYDQYHDECCFMHSLGARRGSKHPAGCSRKLWPEDTRYYENRQNYAEQ
jgi:hypothetical protein